MSNPTMSRKVAAVSMLAAFAAASTAAAQGGPIRELQYTNYLQNNDFDGARVASACNSEALPGLAFRSSADEKNLTAFLQFLKVRPQDVKYFNNGQFSQTAEALGDAVADVCYSIARHSDKDDADPLMKPLTSFDPLIDDVNLSDFMFDYRFQHDHPQGHLPLERRNFPVMQLEVDYDDDNFPDSAGALWTYQTAELIVTVNNYDYFRQAESGRPGAIRQENGSFPCYYTDPTFNAVYRFPWKDCNPETLVEDAPPGMNLKDAVRDVAVNFIERNIDAAGAPVKVEDYVEAEICCKARRAGIGDLYFMTDTNACTHPDGSPADVVSARFCGVDDRDNASSFPGEDDEDDGRDPYRQSDAEICCQDYSGINPNIFRWEDRQWCQNQDDHRVVPNHHCR